VLYRLSSFRCLVAIKPIDKSALPDTPNSTPLSSFRIFPPGTSQPFRFAICRSSPISPLINRSNARRPRRPLACLNASNCYVGSSILEHPVIPGQRSGSPSLSRFSLLATHTNGNPPPISGHKPRTNRIFINKRKLPRSLAPTIALVIACIPEPWTRGAHRPL
jgi:hypothetical protein